MNTRLDDVILAVVASVRNILSVGLFEAYMLLPVEKASKRTATDASA